MPAELNTKIFKDYDELIGKLPLIIYHFVPGHKILYANDLFYNYFNLTSAETLNRVFKPPIYPDDMEIFDQVFNSLSTELPLENFTCRLKFADNEVRWTSWKIIPLRSSSGKFVEFQVAIKDLTESKKTEFALKQNEQKYRLVFDQAADMIVIIDRMGNFVDMNRMFELESGWQKEEMIGKSVFTSRILTLESAQKISSYLNNLLSGINVPAFDIQGVRKDGKVVDYEIHAVPIYKDNVTIAFQAILRNIGERKAMEKALRRSQSQLSNLLANLPGMAYRCNLDNNWKMEFVSSGSFDLTGYPADALIQNNIIAYGDIILPEDKNRVFSEIINAINSNEPFRLSYRIKTAEGKIKWVWEQGIGLKNSAGEVESIEGLILDITEQKHIQEALAENEELYRKLISTLPDMIVITDLQGKIIFVNELGIKLSGYQSFTELKNKIIFDFVADFDKPRALENFSSMIHQNKGPEEYTYINKNGSKLEFEVKGEVLRNLDQSPYGFIFSCRDITKRKKAEADLALSEAKYRTLVDSMQDGVFLIQNGKLNFVNESFAKLIGYTVSELLNSDFTKIIAPEDIDLVLSNFRRRQAGEEVPSSYGWRMLHKDGRRVLVNMSVRIINYQGDMASIGTLKDVTRSMELEKKLVRQKNLLGGAAESSNILLTETDFNLAINNTLSILGEKTAVDRIYIFKNSFDTKTGMPFMSQIYEWVRESVTPQIDNQELQMLPYYPVFSDWYDLFLKGDYYWSLVKNLPDEKKRIMEDEDILSILEVPIKIKNELWGFIGFDDCSTERTWDESEISILKAAAGSIGGAIERERTKAELVQAKEYAEEMNKLKSNFLANMSHELRTPLIAILGYAELLASETENNETKSMLETIYGGGTRLLETLNHILDLSKIESGKVIISPEAVDIKELILEVTSLFNTLAVKKAIYLSVNFSEDNITCILDKRFLRSVLNNLIGNALKFTDKGGVTVDVSLEKSKSASQLKIKVIDTGIGIPESSRKIIFDAFRQVSEGFNRQYEGTGLGLTITKKYVELLDGTIDVSSEIGKGTTFIISLPVVGSDSGKSDTAEQELVLVNNNSQIQRIIFVDDDPASRSVLALFLKKLYDVDVASTGEEALKMMREINYDLVLLDISLGNGLNGLDLIELIRSNERYTNKPIMAVTAHAMVGDRERFLTEGFDDYISKPFTKEELLKKITILADAKS